MNRSSQDFLNRPKQGFVFDYKKWIYKNFSLIKKEIESSQLKKFINSKYLYKLNFIKTRINALRIWKLFVLASYLNETSKT